MVAIMTKGESQKTTDDSNAFRVSQMRIEETKEAEDADLRSEKMLSPTLERDYDPAKRVYSYEQLQVLNLVVHPIWIFDYVERRMRWANDAGLKLWNATSLEELQGRCFQDISAASSKRMEEYLVQLEHGKNVTDQWTNYPNGKATTCHMNVSGIKFSQDEDHMSLMCEGVPLVKEELLQDNLRGVEMIRHLPMAVCQFDMEGKCMFQNPEASLVRTAADGNDPAIAPEESKEESEYEDDLDGSLRSSATDDSVRGSVRSNHTQNSCTLLERFVDPKLGRQVLREIQSKHRNKVDVEAMVRTRRGSQWSAIQLRKGKDPVTGEAVLLYSATDRTDRIRAQQERKAREQKSEFLAIMAHEIRTPLHQVVGFIDLLDRTVLDAEQKSFVRLLKSSAQGLMIVISDVLDYSKLEAGKMKLESIPYEPLSVVEGSLAAIRASCEEKKLYLNLEWNKGIPYKLNGDPNRLRQILLNLLSNAVKFTSRGGISVRALPLFSTSSTTGENDGRPMVRFEVSDTGMGISAEHKRIIFRKYQQANASVARNFGGTGLGLSICQLLVQNMGGDIGVESEFGSGAKVWVDLPADVPTSADITEPSEKISEHDLGPLHILVAEDNKVNQKLLASMLKRMGHTSDVAMNGKQAIDMVEQNDYDVVLMDIQMPVMDGLEATRRLRTMGYVNLPIYGLTASVARNDYQELGFNDWIAKPIPMNDLKSKLFRVQVQRDEANKTGSPEDD